MYNDSFTDLLIQTEINLPAGELLGHSRQSRPIVGYRFGNGELKISLVAGAHADEPTGSSLLQKLVTLLSSSRKANHLLKLAQWFIIPNANPDGTERNKLWQKTDSEVYDLHLYLEHAAREEPTNDIEFGYPTDSDDSNCRPENLAIYNWWKRHQPFDIHGSLHGMGFAVGPWFLLDNDWAHQSKELVAECQNAVREKGYHLHDINRHGEKGFHRIATGFSSCPDSKSMQAYFLAQRDPTTAALFRPSSMETIKSFNKSALTFVTEMPLFIVAVEQGKSIEHQMLELKIQLQTLRPTKEIPLNIVPMNIADQQFFQWFYLSQCINQYMRRRNR